MAGKIQLPVNIEDTTVLKRFLTNLILNFNTNPLVTGTTSEQQQAINSSVFSSGGQSFLEILAGVNEIQSKIKTYVEDNIETVIKQNSKDIAVVAEQFGTFSENALAASWYGLSVKAGGTVAGLEIGSLDPDVTTPGDESSYFRISADNFLVGRAYEDLSQEEKDYLTANNLPNFGTVYNTNGQPEPAFLINWDSTNQTYNIFFNGKVTFNALPHTVTNYIGEFANETDLNNYLNTQTDFILMAGDTYKNTTDSVVYTWDGNVWLSTEPELKFKSTAFIRSATKPSTPTGGTYSSPIPTNDNWSDGIPAADPNKDAQDPVWFTIYEFSNKVDYILNPPTWSDSVIVVDTEITDFMYNDLDNPTVPTYTGDLTSVSITDSDNGWYNNATVNTQWMAIRTKTAGTWNPWSMSKIKGEQGEQGTPGHTPLEGLDYFIDGSTYQATIFLEVDNGTDLSTINTPTSSSFDGTVLTVNNSWSDDPIVTNANTKFLVISIGNFKYNTSNGTWFLNSTWSSPQKYSIEKGVDFFNGATGIYTSFVYRESASLPSKPSGGTYTGVIENMPSSDSVTWQDNPPSNPTNIVWVSTCKYKQDSVTDPLVWSKVGDWSDPSKFWEKGDTGQGQVKGVGFKRSATTLTTAPTGGSFLSPTPTTPGWSDGIPPGSDDLYMSSRRFTSDGLAPQEATWSIPQITASLGQSVKLEFSKDNVNWHDTPSTDDIYMRSATSPDGGATWNPGGSVQIKGERGFPGKDINYIFHLSTSNIVAPHIEDTTAIPNGSDGIWSDAPLQTTDSNPYLWYSKGNSTDGGITWNWHTPICNTDTLIAELKLYSKNNSSISNPGTYSFLTGTLTGQDSNWTQSLPTITANNDVIYAISCIVTGTKNSTPTPNWSAPIIYAIRKDGKEGPQGIQGIPGADGQTTYFHVAYADSADGSVNFNQTSGNYIGTYVDYISGDSANYADYKWVLIKGSQGPQGTQGIPGVNGVNGQTSYLHIKYSDDGTTFTSNSGETVGDWIGTYTDFNLNDSTTFTDYTWKKIKGPTGPQGTQGIPGTDGQTTYTWVKYADNSSGTGLSDYPSGKTYLGLAYNKTTATESTNPSDYTWSLIKGTDGVPGTNGTDGQTTYTWIKYADDSSGTGLSDYPINANYIGIAVNKTTPTESTNPSDYTWSLIKGPTGTRGSVIAQVSTPGPFNTTTANNAIYALVTPDTLVKGDQVVWTNTMEVVGGTEIYQWTGTTWGTFTALVVNGNAIVSGTLVADKITSAGTTAGFDLDGTSNPSAGGIPGCNIYGGVITSHAMTKGMLVTDLSYYAPLVSVGLDRNLFGMGSSGSYHTFSGGYTSSVRINFGCTITDITTGNYTSRDAFGLLTSNIVYSVDTIINNIDTGAGQFAIYAVGPNITDTKIADLAVQNSITEVIPFTYTFSILDIFTASELNSTIINKSHINIRLVELNGRNFTITRFTAVATVYNMGYTVNSPVSSRVVWG